MITKKEKNKKRIITGLILYFFIFTNVLSPVFLLPKTARAQAGLTSNIKATPPRPTDVIVGSFQAMLDKMNELASKNIEKITESLGKSAVKRGLQYFLNTLAYDTATWIASGDKGQKPLFYTEGWGEYLGRVGDNAAGHFIEQLASDQGWGNLCEPEFNVKFLLALGLKQTVRPSPPNCTWSKMRDNWKSFISDANFLDIVEPMFDPWSNDLGIALTVQTNFLAAGFYELLVGSQDRQEGGGLKPVIDKVSGYIKTPVRSVASYIDNALIGKEGYTTLVGDTVADAIDVFVNTLAGKLLQRTFQKGLSLLHGESGEKKYDWNKLESIISPTASPTSAGVADARREFANLLTNAFTAGSPDTNSIDVTSQLVVDGVINSSFKTAIDQKMTVKEALDNGLLIDFGPGSIFGYSALSKQPGIYEGYSHDSMIILRKYRILPVGWELAAAYIKENFQEKIYSLGEIIGDYNNINSPFYRFIDPNWVLKAPATYCRVSGPSDKLLMSSWVEETILDNTAMPPASYDFNRQIVGRDTVCVDSPSCIYENEAGNCVFYGYCTKEEPIWRFNGTKCPSYYESCESFTDADNKIAYYLANTVNSGSCNSDNVGCNWYCANYSALSTEWTCLAGDERSLATCQTRGRCSESNVSCGTSAECPKGEECKGAYCTVTDQNTGRSCNIPYRGASCTVKSCSAEENRVSNPSFEATTPGALALGWSAISINSPNEIGRVSGFRERVYSGSYSLKMSSLGFGGPLKALSGVISVGQNIGTYTLIAKMYNNLNRGEAYLQITDDKGIPITDEANTCKTNTDMAKDIWQEVKCEFNAVENSEIYITIVAESEGGAPNGVVWIDDVDLQPSCPTEDIVIHMPGNVQSPYSKRFLDKDAKECDYNFSGCRELISLATNEGANVIDNGSFEIWTDTTLPPDGWYANRDNFEKIIGSAPVGEIFIRLDGNIVFDTRDSKKEDAGFSFDETRTDLWSMEAGEYYRVSFYGKTLPAPNNNESLAVKIVYKSLGNDAEQELKINMSNSAVLSENWQRFVFDPVFTSVSGSDFRLVFESNGGIVDLDGVQAEKVTIDNLSFTDYKEYGTVQSVYLKVPPDYLYCTGDPAIDHAECNQYALMCYDNEAGCKLYTPTNGDPSVPGITSAYDYCPAECNGYQAFKQEATNFESEEFPMFFIANTARECEEVGCTEFTNLDEVARGGEGREYYTYVRQCVKPNPTICGTFYTWVGSEETGFQLKVYNLKDEANKGEPDEVNSPADYGSCSSIEDAIANPYCKEYYSATGEVSYHIYLNTISCSENCHPYRLSSISVNQASCQGEWVDTDPGGYCRFDIIPEEGIKCSAAQNGCRAYLGNAGANIRTVFFDDFEDGDSVGWETGIISGEATVVGGHSLATFNSEIKTKVITKNEACANTLPECSVGSTEDCYDARTNTCLFFDGPHFCRARMSQSSCSVLSEKSALTGNDFYVVQFWAKAQGGVGTLGVSLENGNGVIEIDDGIRIMPDWQQYVLGPFYLSADQAQPGLALKFAFKNNNGSAWFDNITIKRVNSRVNLIKNTWKTPISCDSNPLLDADVFPRPNAPQFMLGCQEYYEQGGRATYLKSFTRLCRESAVGCEAFIDTKNSSSPYEQLYNAGDGISEVLVPNDELIYLVNNSKNSCPANQKGCRAFGAPSLDADTGEVKGYSTVFKIDNPDDYSTILCTADAVGCKQYVSGSEGITYFKDPKGRVCEYKVLSEGENYGWFKVGSDSLVPDCPVTSYILGNIQPAKACVGGSQPGKHCLFDKDCIGGTCESWVGICLNQYEACTAFVDPVSDISQNLLPNSGFEGYFKVCENFNTPCSSDLDCAYLGQKCSFIKPYYWEFKDLTSSSPNDLPKLVFGAGVLNSTAIQLFDDKDRANQYRNLEKNTLYTISGYAKKSEKGEIRIWNNDKSIFQQFDNSVTISNDKSIVTFKLHNSTDEYQRFVGRFFVRDDSNNVEISIRNAGIYDNIEIKKTGVYYYNDKDLDRISCNGLVDPEKGCVLVNDTSRSLLQYNSLETKNGSPPKICSVDDCDSNTVLKVKPDRVCGEWLDCVSSRSQKDYSTGKTTEICQEIATCDELNPINGKCNHYPEVELATLEFNQGNVDLAKFYSGYAKVGFIWSNDVKVSGYYSYSEMPQKKICVSPDEKFGNECLEDADCETSALEHNGVCQPILKVREDEERFESCRIYPENSSPRWDLTPADTGDKPAKSLIVDYNNPLKLFPLKVPSFLEAASECIYNKGNNRYQGLYGFCVEKDPRSDFLCLNWLPVDELTGGWIGVSGWNDSSLRSPMYMCAEGTSLEVRKSHTESKCYKSQWYETIGLAVAGGFIIASGVFLFIAFGSTAIMPLIVAGIEGGIPSGFAAYNWAKNKKCGEVVCPPGYKGAVSSSGCGKWYNNGTRCKWSCIPDSKDYVYTDEDGFKWYSYKDRYTASNLPVLTKSHIMYCPNCGDNGVAFYNSEKEKPYEWRNVCTTLVKVVDSDGSNAGWKERLETLKEFENRDYRVPDLNYVFDSGTSPFGSIGSSYSGDPAGWSLVINSVSALEYKAPTWPKYGGGTAGFPYYNKFVSTFGYCEYLNNEGKQVPCDISKKPTICDTHSLGQCRTFEAVTLFNQGRERIKRLFAQSYGYWEWNGSNYQEIPRDDSRCLGGSMSGQSCSLYDPNSCKDSSSVCIFSGGICAYKPLKPSDVPDDMWNPDWQPDPNTSCSTNSDCLNEVFCAQRTCYSDNNNDDDDSGEPCDDNHHRCSNPQEICGQAPDGGYGYCVQSPTTKCLADGDCVEYNSDNERINTGPCQKPATSIGGFCSYGIDGGNYCVTNDSSSCSKNENNLKCMGTCSNSSAISGQFCAEDAECQIDGECVEFSYWVPPLTQCPNNTRPNYFTGDFTGTCSGSGDYCYIDSAINTCGASDNCVPNDPLSPGDWCGVAPTIYNIKIANQSSGYFESRSGEAVELSFNIMVDNDQLPLKILEIDWGDGLPATQTAPSGGMLDKRNVEDPFVFSHNYTYQGNCDVGGNSGYCVFKPKIRVQDNWGWCSNGTIKYNDEAYVEVFVEIRVYK